MPRFSSGHQPPNIDIIREQDEIAQATKRIKKQFGARKAGLMRRIPHVVVGGIEKKSCSRCGSLKSLDEYGKNCRAVDGLAYACKTCEAQK